MARRKPPNRPRTSIQATPALQASSQPPPQRPPLAASESLAPTVTSNGDAPALTAGIQESQSPEPPSMSLPRSVGRELITAELEILLENALARRNILLSRGVQGLTRKKLLAVIAGVMALFSAGAIAAVIAKLLGDTVVQIVAAIVAGTSGTISLVINAYYSDEEIVNSLTAASKYLALRQDLQAALLSADPDDNARISKLREFQTVYANLDAEYSRYMPMPKRPEVPVPTAATSATRIVAGESIAPESRRRSSREPFERHSRWQ